ncbi:MAG: hypothetical protein ABSF95_16665 [Verrucomicrobiota bacterium]
MLLTDSVAGGLRLAFLFKVLRTLILTCQASWAGLRAPEKGRAPAAGRRN